MEFSSEVHDGLVLAGDFTKFDDKCFNALSRQTIESITSQQDMKASDDSLWKQVDGSVRKLAFHALVTLFIEATKRGIDSSVLQDVLDSHQFTKERTASLLKLLEERRPDIEANLKSISYHLPHVVDVDWKLDHCIKSDQVEKVDKTKYLVTLETVGDGFSEKEQINFYCTLDDLEDMRNRVKDAEKRLEHEAQSKEKCQQQ